MKARTYKPWAIDDVEFLKEHFFKLSRSNLAKRLDRTEHSIVGKARKLGLSISPTDIVFLKEIGCHSAIEVAQRTGRSLMTVQEWCRLGKISGAFKVMAPSGHIMWAIPNLDASRLPTADDDKYLFGELPPLSTVEGQSPSNMADPAHKLTIRSQVRDTLFRHIFRMLDLPDEMSQSVSEIVIVRAPDIVERA